MSSLAVSVPPSTNAVNALPVPTDMSVRRDDDAKPVSTVAIALQQDMMSSIIRHYISTSSIFSGLYSESKSEMIDDDINRFTKSVIISAPKKSGGRARLTDEQKAERDAKKLAAREAKKAEREAKQAEKNAGIIEQIKAFDAEPVSLKTGELKKQLTELKRAARAAKKANMPNKSEYTVQRLKYPKDHEKHGGNNGPKNSRGKFTRFMKHKTTGEVVKCQPEFWTEEANSLFEKMFSRKPAPLMKPITEEKTQNNTTDELKKQRAIKIAELKAKEAEKKRAAEEAEKKRAAEEAEKQKLAEAQLLSESSQEENNQQNQQEIEDFEQSDDEHSFQESNDEDKSFRHEYWPGQKLTNEDGAILDANGEMVGYMDDDGNAVKV